MKLPTNAKHLLKLIQDAPEQPVKRSFLSKQLGKKRLTAGDLAYLEVMAINGMIQAVKVDSNETPIGYEWHYTFVSDEEIEE